MGVSGFALTCGSEPVVGAVRTAVSGSSRIGRLLDAGSDREGRSSDVRHVGDTRLSFCTFIISAESYHIAARRSMLVTQVEAGGRRTLWKLRDAKNRGDTHYDQPYATKIKRMEEIRHAHLKSLTLALSEALRKVAMWEDSAGGSRN